MCVCEGLLRYALIDYGEVALPYLGESAKSSIIELVRDASDPHTNFTRPHVDLALSPLADECEVTLLLDALRSLLGLSAIPLFVRLFEFFTFHRR